MIALPITTNVRYWHLADMASSPHMSAFGGRADMTFLRCTCLLGGRLAASLYYRRSLAHGLAIWLCISFSFADCASPPNSKRDCVLLNLNQNR